jgi:hypothetical protein
MGVTRCGETGDVSVKIDDNIKGVELGIVRCAFVYTGCPTRVAK